MGQDTLNGSKKLTQFQEELLKFPPILRKLALQALKADDIYTIQELAEQLQLRVESVYQLIYLQKKKGRDFHRFLSETFRGQLEPYRPKMNRALIKEAQKGSFRHLQLYYQLVGDLRPESRNEANATINSLCFVLPMPASIEQPAIPENNSAEDHTVIDVAPAQDTETVPPEFEVVHQCPLCRDSFETLEAFRGHLTREHEAE